MPTASLTALPPAPDASYRLTSNRPVTIGSDPTSRLLIESDGVVPHHAALERRDHRWQIRALDGPVWINGTPVVGPTVLRDRDEVRLAPGFAWEFASGEPRTRRMQSMADMVAPPRQRRYGRIRSPRVWPIASLAALAVAATLVVVAGALAWYGRHHQAAVAGVLTDQQAIHLDSLLSAADDHVERGGVLLELGLGDGALDEFARAVNTLALSDMRHDPRVVPRIQALEASVAKIYRAARMAVPRNYANATSPLTPEQLRTASLTVDQFAASFALMDAAFRARFGQPLAVSGRDHPEHVALYGRGGALDVSIRSMDPTEIAFVIDQCHARHIRIKDFSADSVLRLEVQAAIRTGRLLEAGTGLHLHLDRFANRRDRWTT